MDRRALRAFVLLIAGLTALGALTAAPVATAQPAGCTLGARAVDADTGRPIAGMRKTLVETGEVTTTDRDGVWIFEVAGAGTYTVVSEHPDYPTVTHRYVVDDRCEVTGRTQVPNGAGPAAAPSPPSGQVHRVSGRLVLEDKAAPAGTRVNAYVGPTLCGEAPVGPDGHYTIDVLSAAARPDCGLAGGAVEIGARPRFGSGWLLASVTFQAGATSQLDLAWDPRRQRADAANVPWIDVTWEEPERVAIGICTEMTRSSADAVLAAVGQWRSAFRTQGLAVELVADADTACGDEFPGIALIEESSPRQARLVAATAFADALAGDELQFCELEKPCTVFKSVIALNRPVFARLSAEERANAVAHEIGHALGLDHALACTGGTIMWKDTACRFPMTVVGVDDIASLNEKLAAAVLARTLAPEDGIPAAETHTPMRGADAALSTALGGGSEEEPVWRPSLDAVAASGEVLLLDEDRVAALPDQ